MHRRHRRTICSPHGGVRVQEPMFLQCEVLTRSGNGPNTKWSEPEYQLRIYTFQLLLEPQNVIIEGLHFLCTIVLESDDASIREAWSTSSHDLSDHLLMRIQGEEFSVGFLALNRPFSRYVSMEATFHSIPVVERMDQLFIRGCVIG